MSDSPTVHAVGPGHPEAPAPCCGRNGHEIPRTDLFSTDLSDVTCSKENPMDAYAPGSYAAWKRDAARELVGEVIDEPATRPEPEWLTNVRSNMVTEIGALPIASDPKVIADIATGIAASYIHPLYRVISDLEEDVKSLGGDGDHMDDPQEEITALRDSVALTKEMLDEMRGRVREQAAEIRALEEVRDRWAKTATDLTVRVQEMLAPVGDIEAKFAALWRDLADKSEGGIIGATSARAIAEWHMLRMAPSGDAGPGWPSQREQPAPDVDLASQAVGYDGSLDSPRPTPPEVPVKGRRFTKITPSPIGGGGKDREEHFEVFPLALVDAFQEGDVIEGRWRKWSPRPGTAGLKLGAEAGKGWLGDVTVTRPVPPLPKGLGATGTAIVHHYGRVHVYLLDPGTPLPWLAYVGGRPCWFADSHLSDYVHEHDGADL